MRKITITYLFSLLLVTFSFAQEKVLVTGSVVDAVSGEALPFVTVSLKKQMIGIVTNETGRFDLFIPANLTEDTLVINYMGYKPQYYKVKSIQSPLNIRLQQSAIGLNEVIVKPQPPEFYIKLAILSIKNNYANTPFESHAYYREKVLENKNFVKCNEGIFKTFCPNYLDTVKSQHQLLLFRQEKDIHEVEFMAKERKEAEEKEQRKAERKNEKNRKKGKPEDAKPGEANTPAVDLASSFGGPESILSQGDITRHPSGFLDTSEFKNYKYSFAKSSSYNNNELMVIDFKSKGKVDHMRQEGRIYLDVSTYAIVKVESKGDLVIPVIIRPILFLYGIGIENPSFETVIEFQQVKARWYPKNIQYNVNINLTNKHWFKRDEHSDFVIEGVYTVNKLKVEGVSPIPVSKRFDAKKDMSKQVYNDEGLTWDGINIIKK